MSSDVKLGYIGLGNQGAPMAKRLAEWPGGLIVFDVRAESMAPFAELGATLAGSVAEVAKADVISVTVLNDEQVRDVVAQLAEHAGPGTVTAIVGRSGGCWGCMVNTLQRCSWRLSPSLPCHPDGRPCHPDGGGIFELNDRRH